MKSFEVDTPGTYIASLVRGCAPRRANEVELSDSGANAGFEMTGSERVGTVVVSKTDNETKIASCLFMEWLRRMEVVGLSTAKGLERISKPAAESSVPRTGLNPNDRITVLESCNVNWQFIPLIT